MRRSIPGLLVVCFVFLMWLFFPPATSSQQPNTALFLVIDQDSIDSGAAPNFFSAVDVNEPIADIGLRTQLSFFSANLPNTITLHTGTVGDEGWFAPQIIPPSWDAAGPTSDGLRNYLGNPSLPFPHSVGPGLGTPDANGDREALLDKIPDVIPLRVTGLKLLEGQQVCAVVYDGDLSININFDPINGGVIDGSLKGANLGTVAFEVISVTELTGVSSSSLPQVDIQILDAAEVCEGALELFTDAPEPISSSEPFDVVPSLETPVADAGEDIHAIVSEEISLDGSASFDPQGDRLTFSWTLVSSPDGSTATLIDPLQPNPRLIPDLPGDYTLELVVNDGVEDSLSDRVTVTAFAVDAPPNARAGEDQNVLVGAIVFLDGSDSEDPEQAPLDFSWSFGGVPVGSALTDVDLFDSLTAMPSFIPDVEGAYIVNLQVSDGPLTDIGSVRGLARQPNVGPNADAGADQLAPAGEVTLDGSASFDPDTAPLPLAFSWGFVFTPVSSTLTNTDILDATTATPRFTPDVGGNYVLRLTVDDGERTDADNVLVFVDATPPALQFVSPAEGALLNTNTPELQLSFSDGESGVDTSTLSIQQGGQPLGVNCSFGTGSASCTPVSALPEGAIALSATIADVAGNVSGAATLNFTVDTVAPQLAFTAPVGGSTVTTNTPTIELSFSDSGSGVDTATLAIQANGSPLAVNCTFAAGSGTCTPTTPLPEGLNTLTATIADLAGNLSAVAQVSFTVQLAVVNQAPILDPIGIQTVALGSTLTLNLTATDPDLDPLTFSATPLPLPANSSLNALTGVFTFTPSADQVGTITLTFNVSDGLLTDSETIAITVLGPAVGGITALSGRLLDSNDFALGIETAVVGATVSLLGTGFSSASDTAGNFTLSGIPAGAQILDIDASLANLAPEGSSYAGFREEIELISDVTNIIDRPFFLPRIAANSLTAVNPNFFTTVTNPDLGVSIRVPPNTAKNPDGTNFTGQLSISLVPRDLAPAALPDFLDPALVITIQPVGVTFSTPVAITFPNIDNLPPGSEVDLWSLDASLGVFSIVGTGLVSADGSKIETISGGIRATDWHFALSPASQADDQVPGGQTPIQDDKKSTKCECTSSVQLQNGSIEVDLSLPSYRSLGVSRSLRFLYSAQWAHPQPLIPFNSTIPIRTAIPVTLSYQLSVGGVDQGTETFVDTSVLAACRTFAVS
ncbi:PKD domain-containing protein, partial [Acidobacteria bacterium AH-259-L09]|nr:PKD domain-containing protein [Acidobacteria bacterium AH-259-L09]